MSSNVDASAATSANPALSIRADEIAEIMEQSKATVSGDSDEGEEEGDDEDFEPDTPRRKRQRKMSGDVKEGCGEKNEGDTCLAGRRSKRAESNKAWMTPAPQQQQPTGPTVSGGFIDFPLAPVQFHLICTLCRGYFRDPYTIAECLHTFCKSCLFFAFRSGYRRCPECETSLEPDPFKEALSDRTMQTLVDKIFPNLKEKDERDEKEFYLRRGIKMKKEFQDDAEGSKKAVSISSIQSMARGSVDKRRKHVPDDELDFSVIPDENVGRDYQMPPLQMPKLRASGRLKVSSLKRYLLKKLQLRASPASVEICCNGDPLGDELSLIFITKTRWLDPSEEVQLTYRFGEEGMF